MDKQTTDRQQQCHAPSVYGTGKFQFEVPCKKVIFKNFLKSTGKCICWILIFNEIADLEVCKFIKKRLLQSCFPVNFAKFFRALLLQNIYARLLLSLWNIWRKFCKIRENILSTQIIIYGNKNLFSFNYGKIF